MNLARGFYRKICFPQQLSPFQRIFRGIRGGDSPPFPFLCRPLAEQAVLKVDLHLFDF